MSLRSRLTLAAAAAVAVAFVVASVAVFAAVRSVLRDEVDNALRNRLALVRDLPPGPVRPGRLRAALPAAPFGGAEGFVQLVHARGGVREDFRLPVSERARAVAAGAAPQFFEDLDVAGTHVRVLTAPLVPGFAVQVARPLDEVDRTLRRLALILLAFTLAGIGLAGLLGWAVARAALQPVRALSDATEHVAATQDLTRRIESSARDELGTLAQSFNAMLEALERSLAAQRQLVADASHELRTPLTSLRTNIEVLARGDSLAPEERERLLADVVGQLEELTTLVADVVDLARDGGRDVPPEDVRLDELVAEAVERARRLAPAVRFETDLRPSVVRGVPERLSRAVANLLDNAVKWSPEGGPVEVAVRDGAVSVRDHGPGIAESDLPHVFDRFYRSQSARALPGSGLGLAIVRQVAEAHGGRARAERAPGGGTIARLELAPTS